MFPTENEIGGFEEGRGNIPEQLRLRYRQEGYAVELLSATSPTEALHKTRMFTGVMREMWAEYGQAPNEYFIDNQIATGIRERHESLLIDIPLGMGGYSPEDSKAHLIPGRHVFAATYDEIVSGQPLVKGQDENYYKIEDVDEIEAAGNRELLAVRLEKSLKEIKAWETLLGKIEEQEVFAGDVDKYMVDAFLRLGKKVMPSRFYATLLNLEPSHEGFRPLGEKIEEAFKAFRDVARGGAVVSLTIDGRQEMRTLPNPFALPKNWGLMEFIVEKYIVPRIGFAQPAVDTISSPREKALRRKEELDNKWAVYAALALFKHWDFDAWNQMGVKGFSGKLDTSLLTEEELKNLSLETSYVDSAKAIYIEARRASEYRGKLTNERGERRDHVRKVGPLASMGCYPILSTHALNIITTKVEGKNTRNPDEKQMIDVSIEQAVFGKTSVVRPLGEANSFGDKDQEVTWIFENVSLGDRRMWDTVRFLEDVSAVMPVTDGVENLNEEQKKELQKRTIEFATGVSTDAFEVPYKLQGFLACKYLYGEIMRDDFLKQYDEIVNGELLVSMNKGIDNALGLMATGFNLDKVTLGKLNKYIRTVFLGSLLASLIRSRLNNSIGEGKTLESMSQHPLGSVTKTEIDAVVRTAMIKTFFDAKETPSGDAKDWWKDEKQKKLFYQIINDRKAPTPFELENNWFTKEELLKLAPLYPLIKYP